MLRARASKVAAVTIALGAAVAGCGSSGGTASTTPQPATTVTLSPTDGSTVTPTAGASATPTTGTAIGRCHTSGLALRAGEVDAGAGNRYLPFGLRNASGTTCTITGYVGAQLYEGPGVPLTTKLQRETGPVTTVTLKPGAAAYFYLHWANAGNFDPPCTADKVTQVAITPPDETTQLTATVPMQPCKGMISTAPVSATSR